jgi:hypothetical protein
MTGLPAATRRGRRASGGAGLRRRRLLRGEGPRAAGGAPRARSHCRFVPQLIHFIPESLIQYSVPLYTMGRQCDQTLGAPRLQRGRRVRAPGADIFILNRSNIYFRKYIDIYAQSIYAAVY